MLLSRDLKRTSARWLCFDWLLMAVYSVSMISGTMTFISSLSYKLNLFLIVFLTIYYWVDYVEVKMLTLHNKTMLLFLIAPLN